MISKLINKMSLSHTITKIIESAINTYISTIEKQYNLDKKDLRIIWEKIGRQEASVNLRDNSTQTEENEEKKIDQTRRSGSGGPFTGSGAPGALEAPLQEDLLKCNNPELIALCKQHSQRCSGIKVILISRLLGKDEKSTKKSTRKSTRKSTSKEIPIIKKLIANIPVISIRPNQFGNHEHPETKLVFNATKQVIGKQNYNGNIDELTKEDIELCNKFKFKFKMPKNLNEKTSLAESEDEEIEEIEEEDEEDKEEDEKIEEEVLIEDDEDEEYEEEYYTEEEVEESSDS